MLQKWMQNGSMQFREPLSYCAQLLNGSAEVGNALFLQNRKLNLVLLSCYQLALFFRDQVTSWAQN